MEQPSVPYFRHQLVAETKRLTDLCGHWNRVKDTHPDMPEDAFGHICAVTGKAQLLMNQRFRQFSQLIDACEFDTGGDKRTTCTDLQGFWEMVYFQVEDIHKNFEQLEKLQRNNWEEEKENLVVNNAMVRKKRSKTGSSSPGAKKVELASPASRVLGVKR